MQAHLPDDLTTAPASSRRPVFFAEVIRPIDNRWLQARINAFSEIVVDEDLRGESLLDRRLDVIVLLLIPWHVHRNVIFLCW